MKKNTLPNPDISCPDSDTLFKALIVTNLFTAYYMLALELNPSLGTAVAMLTFKQIYAYEVCRQPIQPPVNLYNV